MPRVLLLQVRVPFFGEADEARVAVERALSAAQVRATVIVTGETTSGMGGTPVAAGTGSPFEAAGVKPTEHNGASDE